MNLKVVQMLRPQNRLKLPTVRHKSVLLRIDSDSSHCLRWIVFLCKASALYTIIRNDYIIEEAKQGARFSGLKHCRAKN